MKMKKIAIILTLLLSLCIVGCSNNNSSSSISDSNKVYKHGLTFIEYKSYLHWFGFINNLDVAFMKEDDSFPTENNKRTEHVVKNFNNTFFYEEPLSIERARNYLPMLQKYGITKETPLTVEWVRNNPYDAYQMMNSIDGSLRSIISYCSPDLGYQLPDDSSSQDSSSSQSN